ncbi:D-mannonate dehydratase [Spirosomataceae bacterium TFI 002]|nr:D-mannonate dehydratase [Spirosomataceae bacterium TFI 002]
MKKLKKTFRWFGPSFGVSLADIKQVGATGIVTACHHIPAGEVWPVADIAKIKSDIENAGLEWSVVESVNVHNAIKTGSANRDEYIAKYIQTLKNLAEQDIKVVCYNFMPVLDWTRTNLDYRLGDGTSALRYNHLDLVAFDLFILKREGAENDYEGSLVKDATAHYDSLDQAERERLQNTVLAGLPGTRDVISLEVFRKHLADYADVSREKLKENLAYFLQAVIPEAEKVGVRMCVHPDDPPFSILGLPRIVSNYEDIKFLLEASESPANGLTFCSGSLGAGKDNDLVKIARDFGDKIHFIHLRNVARDPNGSFHESDHLDGSVPIAKVMLEIIKHQQKRNNDGNGVVDIPMRPDHGHVMLDDMNRMKDFYPGYSTLGRAKGLAELSGLEMGLRLSLNID